MEHLTMLTLGDWSHDGHGWTDNVFVKSNLTRDQINQAHQLGCQISGIDFANLCSEYDDSSIPDDVAELLVRSGLTNRYNNVYAVQDLEWADPDIFAEIYLWLAKLGNVEFEYEIINLPSIEIGGYGLFAG